MAIFHIFKSTLGSSQYVFGGDPEKKSDPVRGKVAHFMQKVGQAGSEFRTSVEVEWKELKAEIAAGHPHIFQDPNPANQTVDSEADPLAALRQQIAAEEKAKLIAQGFQPTKIPDSTSAATSKLQGIANTSTLNSNIQDNPPTIVQVPEQTIPQNVVSVPEVKQDSTIDAVAALKAKVSAAVKTGE